MYNVEKSLIEIESANPYADFYSSVEGEFLARHVFPWKKRRRKEEFGGTIETFGRNLPPKGKSPHAKQNDR